MKRTLITLLSLALSLAAFAADAFDPATAVVTVTDDANCLVNGQNWGMPGDVAANNPLLAPKVNLAFAAYHAKVQTDAQAAVKAAQDAAATAKTASDAAIAANAQELADAKAAVAERDARLAAAAEQIAALQKQVRDLQAAQQPATPPAGN